MTKFTSRTAHMTHRNNIVPAAPVPIKSNRQKYHADMPRQVVDMARHGMFPEEWCAEIGVSMRTIYVWANEWPEFEEAIELAWHLLHAYWARLMRQNIANPAFRQNAALKVMAKRFPATWGAEPRNTLEHFLARNTPDAGSPEHLCSNCERLRNMTDDELRERIKELEERRKAAVEAI